MRLMCCGFENFKNRIMEFDSKIVMFGSGAVGQITTPKLLQIYGLLDRIECYLDNDESKWGTNIEVCGNTYEIRSPGYLENCSENAVILLNISRYSDVLTQLEQMECTENMDCYVMPMMLIHNYCLEKSGGTPVLLDQPVIPKKLHYMWLGGKAIPDNLKRCMESWQRYCPDYEIIEWNENNYDIGKHLYMKQAYEAGAYGFVPDYARLDILYNEGGFYLDTDVELRRNIDDLRYQEAFCGVEKWQVINFGGLSGAVKRHPMIKAFLDARDDILFYNSDGSLNKNTCGFYDTSVALQHGYRINGETQHIKGMNIYASDFFHPYDYMSGIVNETDNTHSVHWFNGGWLDEKMKKANEESRKAYLDLYHKALEEICFFSTHSLSTIHNDPSHIPQTWATQT